MRKEPAAATAGTSAEASSDPPVETSADPPVETSADPPAGIPAGAAVDPLAEAAVETTTEPAEPQTGEIGKGMPKDQWHQAFVDENTILIKRTVRSGQSIQFDGNVVVLGDVNPGSEIIASGNIVVMGALRGVIHAGATGNEEATVSAFKLQPTQLRIANHITRAPDGDYLTPDHPETARIKDGVVVIEMYQLGQDRQTKIC